MRATLLLKSEYHHCTIVARAALSDLVGSWEALTPTEQARVVRLLVARVDYDGRQGQASITFQPLGLKTLAGAILSHKSEEQCA